MRHFQKDSAILNLHNEVKQWSDTKYFLDALPDIISANVSLSMNFDKSIKPGPKSVVWSFDTNAISIFQKLYANIYSEFASQILSNQVYVSHTFRKYSTIQWHGKMLVRIKLK